MQRPRIGILARLNLQEQTERCFVNTSYLEAIEAAGGLPLLLPPVFGQPDLSMIQGLLIPGGIDLDPALYKEEPRQGIEQVDPRLDSSDLAYIGAAFRCGIPIFGICRGMQALVVFQGGTLYQDLSQMGTELAHRQTAPSHCPWHGIKINQDSILAPLLGNTARVNSFHHQGAKQLTGLTPVAWSADGLIEAVVAEPFVLGVQWHPELMWKRQPEQLKLFQAFVEAASNASGDNK
jgi:putative glutamine amidotransferase